MGNLENISVFGDPACYGSHMTKYNGESQEKLIERAYERIDRLMCNEVITFEQEKSYINLIEKIYSFPISEDIYKLTIYIMHCLFERQASNKKDVEGLENHIYNALNQ